MKPDTCGLKASPALRARLILKCMKCGRFEGVGSSGAAETPDDDRAVYCSFSKPTTPTFGEVTISRCSYAGRCWCPRSHFTAPIFIRPLCGALTSLPAAPPLPRADCPLLHRVVLLLLPPGCGRPAPRGTRGTCPAASRARAGRVLPRRVGPT